MCMCVYISAVPHSVLLGGLRSQAVLCLLRETQSPRQVLPPCLCLSCSLLFICSTPREVTSLLPHRENKEQTHKESPASASWQQQSLATHVRGGMAWNGRCSMVGKSGGQLFSHFFFFFVLLKSKDRGSQCRGVTIN